MNWDDSISKSRWKDVHMSKSKMVTSNKQDYLAVDLLKLFFSVCVVGIHTEVLNAFSDKLCWYVMHLIFRLAVPFFMIASGYFLGCKLQSADANISDIFKNYRLRLLPSCITWSLIGLVINIIEFCQNNYSLGGIILRISRLILFYPPGAMWFVAACIVASYIVESCLKHNRDKVIWIIAVGGYLFALLANTYFFLIQDSFVGYIVNLYLKVCLSARNGLFVGVLYIYLGINFAKLNVKKLKYIRMLGVIAFITFVGEVTFVYGKMVKDDSSLFFSLPLLISVIFILALKYEVKLQIPFLLLRKISTHIYYTHPFFNGFLSFIIPGGWVRFFIVLVCSLSVSGLVIKTNYKNRWLFP